MSSPEVRYISFNSTIHELFISPQEFLLDEIRFGNARKEELGEYSFCVCFDLMWNYYYFDIRQMDDQGVVNLPIPKLVTKGTIIQVYSFEAPVNYEIRLGGLIKIDHTFDV